jgi:hypothetical protein
MSWHIVLKRIGRAGGIKQRMKRQREWDRLYGEDMWAVGYLIDGQFVLQEEALETVYYRSYEEHFAQHPTDLQELLALAKRLRNPHAEATTGIDLQVPAIMDYLMRHHLELHGQEIIDIGSWHGQASHAISIRLSPLHIKVVGNPNMTLEQFWQEEKCLAAWQPEADDNHSGGVPQ